MGLFVGAILEGVVWERRNIFAELKNSDTSKIISSVV